ncbi:MAG: DsbE family thiol:disulfide interchange protein, partial [Pseudomonadota bacterium]
MSDTTKPVTEVADGESGSATPRRGRSGVWVPLAIFTVVAALFGAALVTGDPSRLPSMLIG